MPAVAREVNSGARRMPSARLLCFCLLLIGVQNAIPKPPEGCAGSNNGDIRIVNSDSANDTILGKRGKVEICEMSGWKSLCDGHWTEEDATVVCRDLGYSDQDAAIDPLTLTLKNYSRYQYACNGSEAKLADCMRSGVGITGDCSTIVGVQCYNFTVTQNTTSTTPTNLQPSTTLTYATRTVHHVTQSPLLPATVPTHTSQSSLPVYTYAVIGAVVILTVAVCAVIVFIACRSARKKRIISPKSQRNGHIPPEEALYCDLTESQIAKETCEIAQHHVYHEVAPSSVPVYEDIKPTNVKDGDTPKPEPCGSGRDRGSQQDRDTQYATPELRSSRLGSGNRAAHQQGSHSHKKPPPIKDNTCTPYAVNPLAFQKSPTDREFDHKLSFSNDYYSTASSLDEQCGNHVYAVLDGPTEYHPTDSAVHSSHYPIEGELVAGHHYAILERHNT